MYSILFLYFFQKNKNQASFLIVNGVKIQQKKLIKSINQ